MVCKRLNVNGCSGYRNGKCVSIENCFNKSNEDCCDKCEFKQYDSLNMCKQCKSYNYDYFKEKQYDIYLKKEVNYD